MNANSKVQNVRNSSPRGKQSEGARSKRPRSFFVKKFPKYQVHKATNRAFVWWNDRREYLGDANSPESLERYNQFIAEIARLGRVASPVPITPTTSTVLVGEVLLAYMEHVRRTVCSEEHDNFRYAFRELRKLHAHTPVDQFGPKALKQVRQAMVDTGLSRKVINHRVSRIKRLFKFGVADEMIQPTVYQALLTVDGLREGHSDAREKEPILPVLDDDVNNTLPFLSPTVAAMVQFQRLTGVRPAEACRARSRDFDMTDEVWLYQLDSHKNKWRGKQRIIAVGPKAQEVLKPFLDRDPDQYLFRPEESATAQRERFAERTSKKRKTKQYPSEERSKEKRKSKSKPKRKYNEYFTTRCYRQAIARAVEQAQKAGIKVEFWSPLQLRKTRATEIRSSEHGLEGAQVVLGHSKADVTQIYAQRDLRKAIEIAKESG